MLFSISVTAGMGKDDLEQPLCMKITVNEYKRAIYIHISGNNWQKYSDYNTENYENQLNS